MSDRRPLEIVESIAEAIRAGLALIAVVLLSRANAGALAKGPSVWVGVPVCFLVWGAAVGAARWSRLPGGSRLVVWRDCVAPALVTLLMAGSGDSGSLAMGIGLVMMGAVAVGLAAACCRTNILEYSVPARQAVVTKTDRMDSLTGSPEPMPGRDREAPAEPQMTVDESAGSRLSGSLALAVSNELGHEDGGPHIGECGRPNTPAPEPMTVTQHQEALPADLAEIDETSVEDSSLAESWTRTESDGGVSIEAVVLARFIEGSKLAVVHLPFIPPLAAVPQVECEPLDSGCEMTIKTDAAYRHGARLSIARQSAGPAESVPIGVVVYTTAEEPIES